MAQSDEEDDYMKMTFDDAPKEPKYETSLQRAARKRKEVCIFFRFPDFSYADSCTQGEANSRQKSKAEREAEEEAAREASLATLAEPLSRQDQKGSSCPAHRSQSSTTQA